jgi:DNA-binding transcriptional MerR regulator
MTDGTPFLTTAELAKRWGVTPETLRRWRAENKGPSYFRTHETGHVRYSLAAVEGYETAMKAFDQKKAETAQ